MDYGETMELLRETFRSGVTKSVDYRVMQLNNLMKMYEEGADEFAEALKLDLGKPWAESINFETDFNKNYIKTTLYHLNK